MIKWFFVKINCRYCRAFRFPTSDHEDAYGVLSVYDTADSYLPSPVPSSDATPARGPLTVLPHQHPGGQTGVQYPNGRYARCRNKLILTCASDGRIYAQTFTYLSACQFLSLMHSSFIQSTICATL